MPRFARNPHAPSLGGTALPAGALVASSLVTTSLPGKSLVAAALLATALVACSSSGTGGTDGETSSTATTSSSASGGATGGTGGSESTSVGGAQSSGSSTGGGPTSTATGGSGTGGSGTGGSGTGGSGVGGSGSAAPECTKASDCAIVNDCCQCSSLPVAEAANAVCNLQCLIPSCQALGEPSPVASCTAGQCVAFACDASKVLCKSLPPSCPAGQTPLVVNTCWGGCVPVTECSAVTSCASCGAGTACVTEVAQGGATHRCVEVPAECQGKASCACMGASVCLPPYASCADAGGALSCSCPNC